MSVMDAPINPPVQDSAVDMVLPFDLRTDITVSASEGCVVTASGDVLQPSDTVDVIDDLGDGLGDE